MSKRNRGRHAKGARHAKPSEPIITPVTVAAPVAAAVLSFTGTVALMTPSQQDYVIAPAAHSHSAQEADYIQVGQAMQVGLYHGPYVVRPGDSLSAIAKRFWGRAHLWPEIFWVNRHRIRNPNDIKVGQTLYIPHRWHQWPFFVRYAKSRIPHPHHHHAAPAPVAHSSPSHVSSGAPGSFEACVITRESGGNPRAVNPSSGAGGLYQFLPSTWSGLGFPGLPQNASVSMQREAFQKAFAESGVSPWRPYDGC